MNRVLFIVAVLLFCPLFFNGQSYPFNYLTVKDGLSQHDVSCITQDSEGFIWIGTYDGLNRFDGYTIENFFHDNNNPQTLSSNRIRCLFEDTQKRLWIGTDGYGLNFYSLPDGSFNRVETPLNFNIVNDIAQNSKGEILIATNQGLLIVKNEKNAISTEILQTPLTGFNINDIQILKNGDIIYASSTGLWLQHNNEYKAIPKSENSIWNTVFQSTNGHVWAGSQNGLYLLSKSNPLSLEKREEGNIISICNGSSSELWVSTFNKGLLNISSKDLKSQKIQELNDRNSDYFLNNSFSFVYKDASNTIWVGNKEGVAYTNLDQSKFNSIPLRKKGIVSTILVTGKEVFYGIQTDKFYNYSFLKDTITPISLYNDAKPFKIDTLDGEVYLGTTKGLFKRKKDNDFEVVSIFGDKEKDESLIITSMCQDSYGNKYFGTYRGLVYKKGNTAHWAHDTFKNLECLRNVRVFSMMLDNKSNCLWVGTISNGLFKVNLSATGDILSCERYNESMKGAYKIPNNSIWCFFQDSLGTLYVGTDTGLLIKKPNENKFDPILTEGIRNKKIMGIINDKFSNLWLANSRGILKLDLSNNLVTKYDFYDGLPTNAFSGAISKNSDDMLFFGSIKGINYFKPELVKSNSLVSNIAFTGLRIDNYHAKVNEEILGSVLLSKRLNNTTSLELNYKQNDFTIEFTSTNYSNPMTNKFRYKLEGYDDTWEVVDYTKRFASYSNLPSGDYVFKVEAANPDGKWSSAQRNIAINIQPAPWNTWWAYLIYFLLVSAILLTIIYFWLNKQRLRNQIVLSNLKNEKEKEINEMKLIFFTDVAHEFKTPLSLVIGPLNDLIRGDLSKENKEFCYQIISRNTKRMMTLVNQLLDFRKINSGINVLKVSRNDFCTFVKEISKSFYWEAKNKEINFRIISPENYICHFDKDIVEKVIFNVLSNAFKYTPNKGTIEIELKPTWKQDLEYFVILIKDSGKGIPQMDKKKIFQRHFHGKDRSSSGIGLHLAATLIEAHRGEINVFNSSLGGTEFMITLPVSSKAFTKDEYITEEDIPSSMAEAYVPDDILLETPEDDLVERESILIVEDDLDLRKYLKNILKNNYLVYEASNGKEGLDIAIKEIPDFIVTDVMMQEMDGIEMCKKLKENILVSHIPVLMLTAKTGDEFYNTGLEVGAWDYIAKPFNSNQLIHKINNIIETRNSFRTYITNGPSKKTEKHYASYDQKFVKKIIDIVEAKMSEPNFSVEELATELGLSRMQMHRKLKTLIGMNTTSFINSIRIKKAIKMFDDGCDRVQEVMDSVGFNTYAHFNSIFKKEKGVTPQKYMEQLKQSSSENKN